MIRVKVGNRKDRKVFGRLKKTHETRHISAVEVEFPTADANRFGQQDTRDVAPIERAWYRKK